MYLGIRHLRAIRAIHDLGGLGRAAESMNLTQSALSHQIKGLEERAGIDLFQRRSRPLRLSAAGLRLLRLAERVLPEIEAAEDEMRAVRAGRSGRLHIAIECHACFEWLFPVLELYRLAWPQIDIDIRPAFAFDALDALEREAVDFVITSDPEDRPGIDYAPLFDYEPVFVAAATHPLAARPYIRPGDLGTETLITYPVERGKLDVFTAFLDPEGTEPRALRQVELTAIILLLVASGRGVAVLPDWVVRDGRYTSGTVTRRLGENGITRRLYGATRQGEGALPFVAHFVRLARTEPPKRQKR